MSHENIAQLRNLFDKHDIDAYLIPSNDEFLNEYTPHYLNRLTWLTGFESSSGCALITRDTNYIFTDSRYLEAAEQKLGSQFVIRKMQRQSVWAFLQQKNYKIGIAPELFIAQSFMRDVKFVPELVDLIWIRNKINPEAEYFYYDEQYSGASFKAKAAQVCKVMHENNANYLVMNQPELICWLSNLRGKDQEFTPLVLSYGILDQNGELEVFLYNAPCKTPKIEGVVYRSFDEFAPRLKSLEKVMIDRANTNLATLEILGANAIYAANPIISLRAIKNDVEIANAKKIHVIDSKAVTAFLQSDFNGMTESSVADLLYQFRSKSNLFFSPSFETIAGFRENGAIIHYHVRQDTNKKIEGNGLLLIDSGGQYFGGTTDITRTIAIGEPTKEQIFAYTMVLRAHLRLSNMRFKKGTLGKDLDALTRGVLQSEDMDYAHGTGHGVSNFLSVHETPPIIGARNNMRIEAGMIISNEPGYYKTGEYGIRIENLCLVVEIDETTLGMEDLTLVPYDTKLIDERLLSAEEIIYLQSYNDKIASILNAK
jgi:Xaa-Pro aminopeptidase